MALTFFCSGDLGDIIAALPTIRAMGGGVLRIGPAENTGQREPMSPERFNSIAPLIKAQPYIEDVVYGEQQAGDKSFAQFRKIGWLGYPENLAEWQARFMKVKISLDKWLTVKPAPESAGKIVIARSLRYHNPAFPWRQIATRDFHRALFIGSEHEHHSFEVHVGATIERAHTPTLLQVAELIAGAERGYFNASCPLWVAMGLNTNLVEEISPGENNVKISHPNFVYIGNAATAIRWLRSEGFEEHLIPTEEEAKKQTEATNRPVQVRNHNGMLVWSYLTPTPKPEPPPTPVKQIPTITVFPVPTINLKSDKQRIWHSVMRFDKSPNFRERVSWASWDTFYRTGEMIPSHYWNYVRNAADELGDTRALPYLKDMIRHTMNEAQDDDIICAWLNDDNVANVDLPRYLRYHVNEFGPCTASRTELLKTVPPLTLPPAEFDKYKLSGHPGRDMWAAKKSWFEENWDKIPDFILGGSMFDSFIAIFVRMHYGLTNSYMATQSPEPLHPAEIPRGYLGHLYHASHWAKSGYETNAPSQKHNIKLFYDWLNQYGTK